MELITINCMVMMVAVPLFQYRILKYMKQVVFQGSFPLQNILHISGLGILSNNNINSRLSKYVK